MQKRYQVNVAFSIWVEDTEDSYDKALDKANELLEDIPGVYKEVEEWEVINHKLDRLFRDYERYKKEVKHEKISS